MSRSRRKQPFSGITNAESEKPDKKIWHSRMRAKERECDSDSDIWPDEREVSNPWEMQKDGKTRFNPKSDPGRMRK